MSIVQQQPDIAASVHSESELVEQARLGNETAIRKLIKANNQRLFRIAWGVVRNDSEAEDVVQETYVRAFTHLDGFLGTARFSTWLTRIALNDAIGRVRKRRPMTDLDALENAGMADPGLAALQPISLAPGTADSEVDRTQMRTLLENAISQLPETFRLVFLMRDVEGCSVNETAEQLGLKPETVKTRLHRARQALRRTLTEKIGNSFADILPFDGARCDSMADKVIDRLGASGVIRRPEN
ncbi:RNA polymerase sigma factor [Devosia rhodophyticola]|uniref:RNA polymerase sigma factor n=1 Tax=Devosia rhodophyticola TaxID=3026423 RepID=A0ABY7YTJ6_9HYPH|nr:RNA polymerase sigma factor [Devosia rhodophyticola]WDR04532.1 RNA polymerase sigma factor [Devosia rhodophyticola]